MTETIILMLIIESGSKQLLKVHKVLLVHKVLVDYKVVEAEPVYKVT